VVRVPKKGRDPDHFSCHYLPGWWNGHDTENEEGNARYQAERVCRSRHEACPESPYG